MKKLWGWFVGAFVLLAGFFLAERGKRKGTEAQLENAETKATDQLLEYQQGQNQQNIDTQKQELNKLKEEHANSTKENQESSPTQVEDFWNKPGK